MIHGARFRDRDLPERRRPRAPRPSRESDPSDAQHGGPLVHLCGRFRFNGTLFELLADGLVDGDWEKRLGSGPSAHWILGHLCSMRLALLRTVGVERPEADWEARFAVSSVDAPVREDDPPTSELLACFRSTHVELCDALESLSPYGDVEAWEEDAFGLPVTVEDCVGFFYFDETYHLGQLGLARQQLGKPVAI